MVSESTCKKDELKKEYTCLHCGVKCYGKYCHNCGQSLSVSRLSSNDFFIHSVNGIFRINGVFLHTITRLLITPWVVIGGYIKGHRVCYTAPIVMLVLLLFFKVIIESFMHPVPESQLSLLEMYRSDGLQGIILFVLSVLSLNNIVFCYILFPPAVMAIRIVYRAQGASEYNWAEYAFAAIYFSCTILAAIDVLLIVRLIFGVEIGIPFLVYSILISYITLWKAFPRKNIGASIGRLFLVSFCGLIIYALCLGVIIALIYLLIQLFQP